MEAVVKVFCFEGQAEHYGPASLRLFLFRELTDDWIVSGPPTLTPQSAVIRESASQLSHVGW